MHDAVSGRRIGVIGLHGAVGGPAVELLAPGRAARSRAATEPGEAREERTAIIDACRPGDHPRVRPGPRGRRELRRPFTGDAVAAALPAG